MTKSNLVAGMMVVTADGKARLVMPTKVDGLVLMAEDNKALKVSKLGDDLSSGEYRSHRAIVKVYDVMNNVNGHLFDPAERDLLFETGTGNTDDVCAECDCEGTCCGCSCDEEDDYDDDWSDDAEEETPANDNFTKANVTPGMLAVTRDGQNRLAIPTADMGLVLAAPDSKFVRLDKLNDDLTIADYRKDGKNVDKVYGLADGVTTDFYSTDNRALLFDRGNN